MAIGLRFPSNDAGSIAFAVSPLYEAALSLHVLADPKRHPLQAPWVRTCRDLDVELRRELRRFAFAFRLFPPAFLQGGGLDRGAGPFPEFPEFAEAIAHAGRTAGDLVLDDLLLPFADGVVRRPGEPLHAPRHKDRLLAAAGSADPAAARILRQGYRDPAAVRDRLIGLLDRYWHQAFAAQWARMRERLTGDLARSARLVRRDGVEPVLRTLTPQVQWDPRGRVATLARRHEHLVDVEQTGGITLVPSLFAWPHVRVYCDAPWPVSLIYPISAIRHRKPPDAPPDRLLERLRALADGTRLRLLQLIARQPRSTRELAALLYLSDSTVSRHMRQLADAGLVHVRRAGHYLVYTCDDSAIRRLTPELAELLRTE